MALTSSDLTLFGLDLTSAGRWARAVGQRLRDHAWLDWAVAPAAVDVLKADGSRALWTGDALRAQAAVPEWESAASGPGAQFFAAEVPPSILLRRAISLPSMASAHLAEAVALDVRSVSPFAQDDLVYGWRCMPVVKAGVASLDIVLASRRQVVQALAETAARAGIAPERLEAWALDTTISSSAGTRRGATAPPIVLLGFAEILRQGDASRRRRGIGGLLLLLAAMVCAIALTPIVQLQMRSAEADSAFSSVRGRTTALVQQREGLLRIADNAQALSAIVRSSADPLGVMALLTETLPENTYVQTLQIAGGKVSMTGLTDDAAALMSRLGGTPGLREVRAPQAATRQAGTAKETFVVEFQVDPVDAPRAGASARVPVAQPTGATSVPAAASTRALAGSGLAGSGAATPRALTGANPPLGAAPVVPQPASAASPTGLPAAPGGPAPGTGGATGSAGPAPAIPAASTPTPASAGGSPFSIGGPPRSPAAPPPGTP